MSVSFNVFLSICFFTLMRYSQVPNKRPYYLIIFSFFSNPRTLLGALFINSKEIDFSTNPLFHFISLLALFKLCFHGKIACICIYSSFALYNNLLLFFPSLHSYSKRFLNFRPHSPLFFWPIAYLDPLPRLLGVFTCFLCNVARIRY